MAESQPRPCEKKEKNKMKPRELPLACHGGRVGGPKNTKKKGK